MKKVLFWDYENPSSVRDDDVEEALSYYLNHDEFWIQIDDPTHDRNGSILQLERSSRFEFNVEVNLNSAYRRGSVTDLMKTSFENNTEYMTLQVNRKSVKAKIEFSKLYWLPDYTGPGEPKFKRFSPASGTHNPQFDIMDTEIQIGSFVAASSGSGLFLGNVREIDKVKGKYRAKIEILIDPQAQWRAEMASYGIPGMEKTRYTTIGIHNLIVITDDIKRQSMIRKLSA